VLAWVDGGPEPRTVVDAVFAPARLLSLRTRGSAAYKGIRALLLREGARDLRTGEPSNVQNYFDEGVDVHHLFHNAGAALRASHQLCATRSSTTPRCRPGPTG
jgi:hypothetical protein